MIAPKVIIALYFCVLAHFKAARGISKAPGTLTKSIFSGLTPCLLNSSTAPANNLEPIKSLKRESIIQNFSSPATSCPSYVFIIFSTYPLNTHSIVLQSALFYKQRSENLIKNIY